MSNLFEGRYDADFNWLHFIYLLLLLFFLSAMVT